MPRVHVVLQSLLPLVLLIGLGTALRRSGFLDGTFFAGLNRFAYWVALPALLVHAIGRTEFRAGPFLEITWLLAIGTGAAAIAGYVVALAMGLRGPRLGVFVQAAYRGNLAFVGLPVIIFAFAGDPEAGAGDVVAYAILALAPMVVVFNVVAVVVLVAHGPARLTGRLLARQVLTNPLIVATAIGLALSFAPFALPPFFAKALELLADAALAAALLALGAALSFEALRGRWAASITAAAVKGAVPVAAGWGGALLLGTGTEETTMALIFLATPTAVASYTLADQLEGDGDLAAACVVASTVLSLVPLAVVLALTG